MKKTITNSMLTIAIAAGSLVALPACTDGEIIASSILIGAAVISDDDHDHYHHHGHLAPHYPSNPVRPGHHSVSPARRVYALDEGQQIDISAAGASEQAAAPQFVSADARVINTAEKYEISHYAATYVVRAIVLAQSKDLSGLKDLGLEKADMKKIYEGKALSEDKLAAMSAKLLMSPQDTAVLVDDMSQDIQVQKAARQ